jgi:Zn-finger nucleic acid-binding protein
VVGLEIEGDWCPACGGAVVSRAELPRVAEQGTLEVDHRGIVLPRRHAVGGIITPQ